MTEEKLRELSNAAAFIFDRCDRQTVDELIAEVRRLQTCSRGPKACDTQIAELESEVGQLRQANSKSSTTRNALAAIRRRKNGLRL